MTKSGFLCCFCRLHCWHTWYIWVSNEEVFKQYEITKGIMFALACCAFWVGILNSIQEICKERTILKREYLSGLSLGSYIGSKLVVMGIICAVESLLLSQTFLYLVEAPDDGVFLPFRVEIFLTTYLTAMAATATGLFISALVKNPDRAMTIAPIILMPQILFSGLAFRCREQLKKSQILSYAAGQWKDLEQRLT